MPEYGGQAPQFDQAAAGNLARAQFWAHQRLSDLKNATMDETGPVLLFPHHFDDSFLWFTPSTSNNGQLTFGFSTGDTDIAEPYFYVTAYPEPVAFAELALDPPAHWQTGGFHGAVLPYNAAVQTPEPLNTANAFLTAVFRHGKNVF